MRQILNSLGKTTSMKNKLWLISLFTFNVAMWALVKESFAYFFGYNIIVIQAVSWAGWFLWQGHFFAKHRDHWVRIDPSNAYAKCFYSDILHGVSFGVSLMIQPLIHPFVTVTLELTPLWQFCCGGLLAVVGITLLYQGFNTIGIAAAGFFYEFQSKTPNLQVCGIYKQIRHPLFFGGTLVSFGGSLLFEQSETLILGFLSIIILPIYKTLEDKRLGRVAGESYMSYKMKFPAFIPSLKQITAKSTTIWLLFVVASMFILSACSVNAGLDDRTTETVKGLQTSAEYITEQMTDSTDEFGEDVKDAVDSAASSVNHMADVIEENDITLGEAELETVNHLIETTDELGTKLHDGINTGTENIIASSQNIDSAAQALSFGMQNVGLNPETLGRVDTLLAIAERGLEIGPETLKRVDGLIEAINNQPWNWQAAMSITIAEFEASALRIEKELAADLKDILEQAALDSMELSARLSMDARCAVEHSSGVANTTANETAEDLFAETIISDILINTGTKAMPFSLEEKPAYICSLLPDVVELERIEDQIQLKHPLIKIYGFDFNQSNLPDVRIVNVDGVVLNSFDLRLFMTSPFEAQISLQGLNISELEAQSRLILHWPGSGREYSIPILVPEPLPPAKAIVASSKLNVRYGPGLNYDVMLKVNRGEQFPILGISSDNKWVLIKVNGQEGWVSLSLIRIQGDTDSIKALEGGINGNESTSGNNYTNSQPTPTSLPDSGCVKPEIIDFRAIRSTQPGKTYALVWEVRGANLIRNWGNVLGSSGSLHKPGTGTLREALWAKVDGTPDYCYTELNIEVNVEELLH